MIDVYAKNYISYIVSDLYCRLKLRDGKNLCFCLKGTPVNLDLSATKREKFEIVKWQYLSFLSNNFDENFFIRQFIGKEFL